MEILRLLLSFFLKNQKNSAFARVLELLEKNSFNIGQTLKNLNLDAITPIVQAFMKNTSAEKENPTDFSVGNISGLNPIANIADKEIVYTLNKYFYAVS